MGTFACPHYLNGECDGYIDSDSKLPKLKLDDNKNIISGCSFEIFLNLYNTTIKEIKLGKMEYVDFDKVLERVEKIIHKEA